MRTTTLQHAWDNNGSGLYPLLERIGNAMPERRIFHAPQIPAGNAIFVDDPRDDSVAIRNTRVGLIRF